jgi:hypothetical protein
MLFYKESLCALFSYRVLTYDVHFYYYYRGINYAALCILWYVFWSKQVPEDYSYFLL